MSKMLWWRAVASLGLAQFKNFKKGHILEDFDMTIKRPGNGLEPKFKNKIIGNVLSEDVVMDEPINWNHFL